MRKRIVVLFEEVHLLNGKVKKVKVGIEDEGEISYEVDENDGKMNVLEIVQDYHKEEKLIQDFVDQIKVTIIQEN